MNYKTIQYEVKDGVATITLNRPDVLNAINVQMLQELRQAIEGARTDTNVRAVLLTGTGQAFCSGADLAAFGGGLEATNPLLVRYWLVELFNPIILSIFEMEKPWVAAVNGATLPVLAVRWPSPAI